MHVIYSMYVSKIQCQRHLSTVCSTFHLSQEENVFCSSDTHNQDIPFQLNVGKLVLYLAHSPPIQRLTKSDDSLGLSNGVMWPAS